MIKTILLDIDGVIIGDRANVNAPLPHPDVLWALQQIQSKGVRILLVTARPQYGIPSVLLETGLDNFHITNAGALLINSSGEILEKHAIQNSTLAKLVTRAMEFNIYTEVHTLHSYFIQLDQVGEVTKKHSFLLQHEPTVVESLLDSVKEVESVEVMMVPRKEGEKEIVNQLLSEFSPELSLSWGVHPILLPLEFGIIASGASKKQAAINLITHYGFEKDELLGIGDSTSDWDFMELCGQVGTLKNAPGSLQELVLSYDGKGLIGNEVNHNGVLDVFLFFGLI